jgi:DNA-binding response OmpR family regulator
MSTVFGHGRLRGLRVLVVAGNGDIRELLKVILTSCAGHPLAVASSHAGDVVLERFKPDALLVDLPLVDRGHALLRHAARAHVPVVALDFDRVQQWSGDLLMSGFTVTVVKRMHMDDVAHGVLTAIAGGTAA